MSKWDCVLAKWQRAVTLLFQATILVICVSCQWVDELTADRKKGNIEILSVTPEVQYQNKPLYFAERFNEDIRESTPTEANMYFDSLTYHRGDTI